MSRLAREVQRSLLHRGKISQAQYDEFRKPGRAAIEERRSDIEFMLNQTRGQGVPKIAVSYHPTGGFKVERSSW